MTKTAGKTQSVPSFQGMLHEVMSEAAASVNKPHEGGVYYVILVAAPPDNMPDMGGSVERALDELRQYGEVLYHGGMVHAPKPFKFDVR